MNLIPIYKRKIAVRYINNFPPVNLVIYAPKIEPGIIVVDRSHTCFHFMYFSFWYMLVAIVAETTVMGRGLAKARYGGVPKNILRRGVVIELPPNPNIPEGIPTKNPSIARRRNSVKYTTLNISDI